MCQYDIDVPHRGHPHLHTGILQKMKLKKGHNSHNNGWILPQIELDLYFMIIYLCIKYESNILILTETIFQC